MLQSCGPATGPLAGTLVSRSPYLTVLDGSGQFGACAEGDTIASYLDGFALRAAGDAPVEVAQYCDLVLDGSGFHDTVRVPVIVGDSMNLPDGPTAYGYGCFDHTDSTYDQIPGFDWFELRGVGTPTGLGGDEAVQVPLPPGFGTWRYFGQDHDTISICSNGFVSAGWSDRVDFVNVRLPYHRSPPNIVAVAWDDLHPPDGGEIWYYHDEANHRFVVEFDSIRYFGLPELWEKVQVQVHDRTVPTPTGDNAIDILFKTANYFTEATVGMQNSDGSEGLTHAWNGWLPRTAAPLVPGRALRIEPLPQAGISRRPGVFRPRTAVSVSPIPARSLVRISLAPDRTGPVPDAMVFSADGRFVRGLGRSRSGQWEWDCRDNSGVRVAPGAYFVRFTSGAGFGPARVLLAGR